MYFFDIYYFMNDIKAIIVDIRLFKKKKTTRFNSGFNLFFENTKIIYYSVVLLKKF